MRIGGGVSTIRQYLQARPHLVIAPVLLGAGEHLWSGLDLPPLAARARNMWPAKKK